VTPSPAEDAGSAGCWTPQRTKDSPAYHVVGLATAVDLAYSYREKATEAKPRARITTRAIDQLAGVFPRCERLGPVAAARLTYLPVVVLPVVVTAI